MARFSVVPPTRSYHGQTQHSCADELRADRCRILTNDHEQRDEGKEAEVREGHASQAGTLDKGEDGTEVEGEPDEEEPDQGRRRGSGDDVEVVSSLGQDL